MIDQITEAILLAVTDPTQLPRIAALAKSVGSMANDEVDELLDRLLDFEDELERPKMEASDSAQAQTRVDQLLQPIIDQLCQREAGLIAEHSNDRGWNPTRYNNIRKLYRHTPTDSDLRNHILRWIATADTVDGFEIWTDLICDDPPEHRLGIVLAFSPLMQPSFVPQAWMLSKLINNATSHSQIAPAIFDMFNYFYRQNKVDHHPAHERIDELTNLLGQLSGQLGKIEEGDFPTNFDAGQINQLVSDSVALIVALCDTFALLEHKPAIGKLHQAMSLKHRRVQTEAAAALARLEDEAGKAMLISLAEQPVARLRVLAYAEELGFTNDISLELQGEIAIAESHLAIWLSEPAQMGLAPSNIEFMDNRELYWPSYEHPVQCYLFKYSYGTGEQSHTNIGICGPMTHAFAADLQHLECEDIYAAFAGWQTVHTDIFLIALSRAEQTFANEFRSLKGQLDAEGFDELELRTAGSFFGQIVLVASAAQDGNSGTVIADGEKTTWISQGNPAAPIDWQMAYAIWRGQQMLASFNESESA